MKKGLLSIPLAAALVAGAFSVIPAQAQTAIPPEVSIDDPFGDANYINDQGNGGSSVQGNEVPRFGDVNDAPNDASTVADLGKIWFAHDAATITLFVQTELPLGSNAPAYVYDVFASPGEGSVASSSFWCLRFAAVVPGQAQGQQTTWHGEAVTKLIDRCNVGANFWNDSIDGEQVIEEGPDGTGLIKLTFPRSFSPLLADGSVLTTPYARSANVFGEQSAVGFVSAPQVDNTVFGIDYTITAGGDAPPPVDEPPVVEEPEEPKKLTKADCMKMKNKKKRKRCLRKVKQQNKPPADECPAYVPGEQGAEAELVTVTDENTEEAPLEITVEQEAGMANDQGLGEFATGSSLYDGTAHAVRNVQVDTGGTEGGLFIRYEFPTEEDHDFYVNYANGSEAAHVGGFNPAPVEIFDGTGAGGHSEQGAEQLDGLRTADCAGYTVDLVNFLGAGGEYTVKLWLGEIQNDPAAPAEDGGARGALAVMQETLK